MPRSRPTRNRCAHGPLPPHPRAAAGRRPAGAPMRTHVPTLTPPRRHRSRARAADQGPGQVLQPEHGRSHHDVPAQQAAEAQAPDQLARRRGRCALGRARAAPRHAHQDQSGDGGEVRLVEFRLKVGFPPYERLSCCGAAAARRRPPRPTGLRIGRSPSPVGQDGDGHRVVSRCLRVGGVPCGCVWWGGAGRIVVVCARSAPPR